ncbi:Transcription factor-like protein DPB [Porphyridium purpureum]|uniref:Transcription factor-like protein DPB n=1 Tax=Porphyridium purpureum TaxID=35688 RepID=A0A5J4YUY1_PORPP|nr:Transcription factor-like protein DPB [Porphyridium purpureum]|eukprot:POR9689..scf209_3
MQGLGSEKFVFVVLSLSLPCWGRIGHCCREAQAAVHCGQPFPSASKALIIDMSQNRDSMARFVPFKSVKHPRGLAGLPLPGKSDTASHLPGTDEASSASQVKAEAGHPSGGVRQLPRPPQRLSTQKKVPYSGATARAGAVAAAGANSSGALSFASGISKCTSDRGAGFGRRNMQGLRHFSLRVAEAIEKRKVTTYVEVANEIVEQLCHDPEPEGSDVGSIGHSTASESSERNIRRRVYDAINVLIAVHVIYKQDKAILWRGLEYFGTQRKFEKQPNTHAYSAANRDAIQRQRDECRARIELLKQRRKELMTRKAAMQKLIQRNEKCATGCMGDVQNRVYLPIVLVDTDRDAVMQVEEWDHAHEHISFQSDAPFSVHGEEFLAARLQDKRTTRNANLSGESTETPVRARTSSPYHREQEGGFSGLSPQTPHDVLVGFNFLESTPTRGMFAQSTPTPFREAWQQPQVEADADSDSDAGDSVTLFLSSPHSTGIPT